MPFIAYPHRRRTVPFRLLLPNLLTTIALCSGMASIHFSLKAGALPQAQADPVWEKALGCIFLAAVFDMLDGRAARILKAQSPFGAMLDSLSDFLCFGVAPALLLHQWTLNDVEINNRSADAVGLAAVMTYVLCAALRLARFTAAARVVKLAPGVPPPPEPRPSPHAFKFFVGMPSPAAAGAVLIPPMLAVSTFPHAQTPDGVVILFTFLISGLMVGRQPMFSFKRVRIPRRWVVPFFVLIGLVVVGAAKFPFFTAALVCGAYLLTTPLSMVMHRRLMVGSRPEPVPTPQGV